MQPPMLKALISSRSLIDSARDDGISKCSSLLWEAHFCKTASSTFDQKEHFYEAPYSYKEDDIFYQELITPEIPEEFLIPEPNPFIPKKASVPERSLKDNVYPELLIDKEGVKLYFGQDHEFLRPKGVIGLKVMFPKTTMNLTHRVHSKIYAKCVNESLNELGYPAKQAGLNFSVKEGYEGIY